MQLSLYHQQADREMYYGALVHYFFKFRACGSVENPQTTGRQALRGGPQTRVERRAEGLGSRDGAAQLLRRAAPPRARFGKVTS
jgi:hypothetical protein